MGVFQDVSNWLSGSYKVRTTKLADAAQLQHVRLDIGEGVAESTVSGSLPVSISSVGTGATAANQALEIAELVTLNLKDFATSANQATANEQAAVLREMVQGLKVMIQLLKPLGIVTGAGSNRLQTDIYNITTGTLATVTTVSSLTNQVNIGGINAFQQMKDLSTSAFQSIRNNIV